MDDAVHLGQPPPAQDRYGASVVVLSGVHELRRFAGDIARPQAEVLLPHYHGYDLLSDSERAAVLARFPAVARHAD